MSSENHASSTVSQMSMVSNYNHHLAVQLLTIYLKNPFEHLREEEEESEQNSTSEKESETENAAEDAPMGILTEQQ
jgi:hypothetical protein